MFTLQLIPHSFLIHICLLEFSIIYKLFRAATYAFSWLNFASKLSFFPFLLSFFALISPFFFSYFVSPVAFYCLWLMRFIFPETHA